MNVTKDQVIASFASPKLFGRCCRYLRQGEGSNISASDGSG